MFFVSAGRYLVSSMSHTCIKGCPCVASVVVTTSLETYTTSQASENEISLGNDESIIHSSELELDGQNMQAFLTTNKFSWFLNAVNVKNKQQNITVPHSKSKKQVVFIFWKFCYKVSKHHFLEIVKSKNVLLIVKMQVKKTASGKAGVPSLFSSELFWKLFRKLVKCCLCKTFHDTFMTEVSILWKPVHWLFSIW